MHAAETVQNDCILIYSKTHSRTLRRIYILLLFLIALYAHISRYFLLTAAFCFSLQHRCCVAVCSSKIPKKKPLHNTLSTYIILLWYSIGTLLSELEIVKLNKIKRKKRILSVKFFFLTWQAYNK